MPLGELRHVERDECVLVTEEELRQCLGELGLAHARRPGEDEGARRTLGVLEACTSTTDRLGQGLDRLLLADNALVQLVLHALQARNVVGSEIADRDAGHECEHFTDETLIDFSDHVEVARLPFALALNLLGNELLLGVTK